VNGPRLKVFLCHASDDKAEVRNLYQRLSADQIQPWLDEENLLAGQDWNTEIRTAVKDSDVVVVCLSKVTINKSGYVQKEIKHALDIADEKPEGIVFIIPLKLEECEIPDRLSQWQWVNYFEERGYERLIKALRSRAASLGLAVSSVCEPEAPKMVKQEPTESTVPTSVGSAQLTLVPIIESHRTSADNVSGIDYYAFRVSIRNDCDRTIRDFRLEVEVPNDFANPTHQFSMSGVRFIRGDVTVYRHTEKQFPDFVLYPKDVSELLMNTDYQMRFDQYRDANGVIRVSVYSDDVLLGSEEYSIRDHRNNDRMDQLGLNHVD